MSRRQERVAERIREEASKIILQELNDPRMGFVTVTRAEVTPDLKEAKIFVSILGPPGDRSKTMHALIHARGHVQELLAGRLDIRSTPRLWIGEDESVKQSIKISKILHELHEKGEMGEDVEVVRQRRIPERQEINTVQQR